ncbi:hypothetical protein [Flavimaricola marinus]|uniref:Uncharacterized protein n=1 Tax=Flavimaricola marinus TaxID=1819565 RepID=A0A238LDL6_9RHOB|nr:hypothetical protein [Flavimaricola marinus]SMY07505.1 hypothetical protein LOM8899_01641 [Flavimaricola marinus]
MRHGCALVLACMSLAPLSAHAQEAAPLSAIDWLSRSVESPPASASAPAPQSEAPVANSASTPEVTVTSLDRESLDSVGLLPPETTGLPSGLWATSSAATLTDLIRAERVEALPAVRDLLVTLLIAEADAPAGTGADGDFLLARVDKLLDLGALEPARAMLEKAGVDQSEIYRRWFDVSLLTSTEDTACEELRNRPALAPTYPARIFCMARNGNWNGAALTLNTSRALGDVSEEDDALLSRFLDPAIADGAEPLPAPSRLSPLVFLIRDAIGEPLPTGNLPLAFAHADLRDTVAWRNQLEAAERLARNGAISEEVLLAVYKMRTPAASGGVWDRAEAIQRFDLVINARDPSAVAAALPRAWEAMKAVRTEVAFARLYADALAALPLTGESRDLAIHIGLLGQDYEAVAQDWAPETARDRLLQAVAKGSVFGLPIPSEQDEIAVFDAFAEAPVPEVLAAHIAEGRLGEALLRTISAFSQGIAGDQRAMTDGLAALRSVGLEDTARRIALQYLILDRPS